MAMRRRWTGGPRRRWVAARRSPRTGLFALSALVIIGACDPAPSCAPAPSQDPAVPANAAAPPGPAAPATLPPPARPPGAGQFSDGFANLDNWSIARWANTSEQAIPGYRTASEPVCGVVGALPPNDVVVCDGRVDVSVANVGATNYSDSWLRSDAPYDFRAGGTFSVDLTTAGTRNDGFTELLFTSTPYSATSVNDLNSNGPTPADGMLIHFWDLCASAGTLVPKPAIYSFVAHQETFVADRGQNCATNVPTDMTRVNVNVVGHEVSITANGRLWWTGTVPGITPTGYVYIGVHNHSTSKYSGRASLAGSFDNVSYPALPATIVSEVADLIRPVSGGESLHRTLPTGPLVLPGVPAGVSSAWLAVDLAADHLTDPGNGEDWYLEYSLNGGPAHRVPVEEPSRDAASRAFSIPVNVGELVAGDNTISFTGGGWGAAQQAFVGNIDLVSSVTR